MVNTKGMSAAISVAENFLALSPAEQQRFIRACRVTERPNAVKALAERTDSLKATLERACHNWAKLEETAIRLYGFERRGQGKNKRNDLIIQLRDAGESFGQIGNDPDVVRLNGERMNAAAVRQAYNRAKKRNL